MEILSGIIAHSEKYAFRFHSDYGDWELVGRGEAYADCGSFGFRGCLKDHVVQKYKRSCNRAECPICYEGWASLEAKKIVFRLAQHRGRWRNPCHVSFNPAPCLWLLPKDKLVKELYKVAKRLGLNGGALIFHPKRKNGAGEWFVSPHFHGLVYGWHRAFHIRGWVVKNHGARRSEKERFTTARYQLSHAGTHSDRHTVVWFGSCSYNKKGFLPMLRERHLCPICKEELRPLLWVGLGDTPPPLKNYVWKDDDWIYAPMPQFLFSHGSGEDRAHLVDREVSLDPYRFCLEKSSKIENKPIVAHDLESLKKANPLAPDWYLKLFLSEKG